MPHKHSLDRFPESPDPEGYYNAGIEKPLRSRKILPHSVAAIAHLINISGLRLLKAPVVIVQKSTQLHKESGMIISGI